MYPSHYISKWYLSELPEKCEHLIKEVYAIYMSFCKMVFYLKDVHVMIWYDHASLYKFIYSVTRNNKVNSSSQEIHAITPCIDFEHIKRKGNILAVSLSWLQTRGWYEVNNHEKDGKSIFDSELDTMCNTDDSQKVKQNFEDNSV